MKGNTALNLTNARVLKYYTSSIKAKYQRRGHTVIKKYQWSIKPTFLATKVLQLRRQESSRIYLFSLKDGCSCTEARNKCLSEIGSEMVSGREEKMLFREL